MLHKMETGPTLTFSQPDFEEFVEKRVAKDLRMFLVKIAGLVMLGLSHAFVAVVSSSVTYVLSKYV